MRLSLHSLSVAGVGQQGRLKQKKLKRPPLKRRMLKRPPLRRR